MKGSDITKPKSPLERAFLQANPENKPVSLYDMINYE